MPLPNGNGQMPDHEDLEPVDHDPFADETLMKAMAVLMSRMDALEDDMAQALAELRGHHDALSAGLSNMHQTVDSLHSSIRAPKRIVRDEDGRPSHIEIDQGGGYGG